MKHDSPPQGHQPEGSQAGCQGDAHHASQGRGLAGKPGAQEGVTGSEETALEASTPQTAPRTTVPLLECPRAEAFLFGTGHSPSAASLLLILFREPGLCWLAGIYTRERLLALRDLWRDSGFPDPELPQNTNLVEGLERFLASSSCPYPRETVEIHKLEASPEAIENIYTSHLRRFDTKCYTSRMKLKETLLRTRDDLIEKREAINRDIRHVESLLVSQCGWIAPLDLHKVDTSVPAIRYNQEAREYIREAGSWGDTSEVTSTAFIEWLGKKFSPEAVKENSARGAIVLMEKEGLLKVKTEGRGRISTTYSIAPEQLSVTNP